jgi:DNA-directed RNA polymerase beta' subunit
VVTAIIPEEDMPYLPDGTPVEIILNPLSVPSRMNLGQLLETHLGWAAAKLNRRMTATPFCGADVVDIEDALTEAGLPKSGTAELRDGRNGEFLHYPVTVGVLYMMKLNHMVADKVHARSTGPYSLANQQPTGGRSRFGGQRFGEMEVWATEAHGAGHVLHEMLTLKSDDVSGRQALRAALSGSQTDAESGFHLDQGDIPFSARAFFAQLRGAGFDTEIGNGADTTSTETADVGGVRISLASSEAIRKRSKGEVTCSTVIDEKTDEPAEGGIFCERIFGPGSIRNTDEVAPEAAPPEGKSELSTERMGHVELAVPVCHPWVLHAVPELMAALIGIPEEDVADVAECRKAVVEMSDGTRRAMADSEAESLCRSDDGINRLGSGGTVIRDLLAGLKEVRASDFSTGHAREFAALLEKSNQRPESMVLESIPVIPVAYRPATRTADGSVVIGGPNDLYLRLIARNEACRNAIREGAPDIIVREKERSLQEAVEMLLGNGDKRAQVSRSYGSASVASLSDLIRSKESPIRITGKRVDFSGRSVIVSGPELKLTQCGLPRVMARELFRPFVLDRLMKTGAAAGLDEAAEMAASGHADAENALAEVIKGRVVILNRAPTLHRYGVLAFEPVIVEHKAIALHPLVCMGFNADYDGDQMAVHLPLTDAAQAEAKQLMGPLRNLLHTRSGEVIAVPTQDIVYGLHYLTLEKQSASGAGQSFTNEAEALAALESGEIDLHAQIVIPQKDQPLTTTPGRLLFNAILPDGHDFINETLSKRSLARLTVDIHDSLGVEIAAATLDRMKELGFKWATRSGATIGKDQLRAFSGKEKILSALAEETRAIEVDNGSGKIADDEARFQIYDLWTKATEEVTAGVKEELAGSMEGLNPVHLMTDSGARGNLRQVRQLSGMRGLMMAGPDAHDGLVPVPSSFLEGLTWWEHFISAYGARRGLMDTALKSADAGYLGRKFVMRARDVVVAANDCGTGHFVTLEPLCSDTGVIEDVADRSFGRIAARPVIDPNTKQEIVGAGELIGRADAERIREAGVAEVAARSVLCCEQEGGVCAACYGSDLTTGKSVEVGTAVGMIAAHSIEEPVVQLTFRTFYLASPSRLSAPVKGGLPRLAELERTGPELEPMEFVRSATAIFREQGVRTHDKHFEVMARTMHQPTPKGFLARAWPPPKGETTTSVFAKAALAGETDTLLGRREKALFGRCASSPSYHGKDAHVSLR